MRQILSSAEAFSLYEKARRFMPAADFPCTVQRISALMDIAGEFDVAVLDSFGVLNVGDAIIPGAAEAVIALRSKGKHVIVLTNGATLDQAGAVAKVRGFGFDIDSEDVISSRSALRIGLQGFDPGMLWGIMAPPHANCQTLGIDHVLLDDAPETFAKVDGFIMLSAYDWPPGQQALLQAALAKKVRPVLVGNPDLVSPQSGKLLVEPGYFAWCAYEKTGVVPQSFGKPHPQVFEQAKHRIRQVRGVVDPARILMVGDSLHTDILGGAAAGFKTVLTTQDGFLSGVDPYEYFEASGIRPNYMLARI